MCASSKPAVSEVHPTLTENTFYKVILSHFNIRKDLLHRAVVPLLLSLSAYSLKDLCYFHNFVCIKISVGVKLCCVCVLLKLLSFFSCLFSFVFLVSRDISTCPNCVRVFLCFCEQQHVQMAMNKDMTTHKHVLQICCHLHLLKFTLNILTTEIPITIPSGKKC